VPGEHPTELWGPWRAAPERSGVLSDFDGTLAAIVEDPAQARLLPGAAELLEALSDRLALVAVVSGRPLEFLTERLGPLAGRLTLVGLYGLERSDRGCARVDPAARRWRAAVEQAATAARRGLPSGVEVEAKGLAVTLHARRAPSRRDWIEARAAALAAELGLLAEPGRLSVELRPPLPVDKGTVVEQLAGGLRAACYLGDDRADLPAFAALARCRAAGVSTLGVAVDSAEAPGELLAAADIAVEGPREALALLAGLLEALA